MENPTTYPTPVITTIMKEHDPNEDPFADLVDDSQNQMISPLEYGSGAVSPPKQQSQRGVGDDEGHQEETEGQVAAGDDGQHSN